MSVQVVTTQMVVIFAMMLTGYCAGRKKKVPEPASKCISYMITNITNPALLLASAFNKTSTIPVGSMLHMAAISVVLDIFLVGLGILLPKLLRVPDEERVSYNLLCVFGNTGMIGIPLITVVLGGDALVYLGVFNILYTFLMYTYLTGTLDREAGLTASFDLRRCVNLTTVISFISIMIFAVDVKFPAIVVDTANYMGQCTCFLSVFIIGVSMSREPLGDIFRQGKMYLFSAIRYLLVPVAGTFFIGLFVKNGIVLSVCALIFALPAANMPAIMAEERGLDNHVMVNGIILTTILSLVFIPVVVVLVS